MLVQGSAINLAGMGATLLGLQATVGLLVAKTLTNATGGQAWQGPLALRLAALDHSSCWP